MKEEHMNSCRCCGQLLSDKILLQYSNMPKSAQFFPDENSVKEERGVDITLKQCPYCGLIQTLGTPVSYYRDVIRATGVSEEMREFREKQFAEWVKENRLTGKSIIEIGCGCGEYMNFMETTGAKVTGLEHLTESVKKGVAAGHNIVQGYVEHDKYEIPEAPYEGFYIMNFLEHIPQPEIFLRGIAVNLTENGVGLVEVPNVNMILEQSLYSEFIQDHLSYFTRQTLQNILERNGFEVIECDCIWYDYIISAKVRKRTMTDLSGFQKRCNYMQKQVDAYLEKQQKANKKVAVWGAGHQALANLSLLGLENKVACVIDSAKFKQGKYTPATHLPIVAPEVLEQGEIQSVLIMAAGYSDEVKQIMQKKYPQIACAILRDDGVEEFKEMQTNCR